MCRAFSHAYRYMVQGTHLILLSHGAFCSEGSSVRRNQCTGIQLSTTGNCQHFRRHEYNLTNMYTIRRVGYLDTYVECPLPRSSHLQSLIESSINLSANICRKKAPTRGFRLLNRQEFLYCLSEHSPSHVPGTLCALNVTFSSSGTWQKWRQNRSEVNFRSAWAIRNVVFRDHHLRYTSQFKVWVSDF